MLRAIQAITILLTSVVHQTAVAQQGPPAAKHLKPIGSFVGVWETRFDPPGAAPEGDLKIQFHWMGNKSYLQSTVIFHPDGAPDNVRMNPEFMVIGYSQKDSANKAWHFKYEVQGRSDAIIETNRLVVRQQEGTEGESGFRRQSKTYELTNSNTMVITESSHSGGVEAVSPPPIQLQRSPEAQGEQK